MLGGYPAGEMFSLVHRLIGNNMKKTKRCDLATYGAPARAPYRFLSFSDGSVAVLRGGAVVGILEGLEAAVLLEVFASSTYSEQQYHLKLYDDNRSDGSMYEM